MSSALLRRVRVSCGEDAIAELLTRAGSSRTAAYLEDVGNWIDYEEVVALFEAAAELTGDRQIGRRAGEEMVAQHAGTAVATLLRSLGSPEAILEQVALTVTKFSTISAMEPMEVAPGRAVVRAFARPGFKRDRHLCNFTRGILCQTTVLFGLPPAAVEESQCQVDGAPECLYTVTWDASLAEDAADPKELVTALEAQLVATGERLENVYATAHDLISHDDLDSALGRIIDRAATAARAPRYLLAVRMDAAEQLRVHHRGFDEAEALAEAHRLLEAEPEDGEGSRLVVDVRSQRRHYGRLMAVYPTEQSFFAQEHDLLEVYARYAAAVLDTATALAEAQHQHDQARALLELSRAVAAAGTSEEVARRLADAVPAVVDCDRTGVFVWLEGEQSLACMAAFGQSDEQVERLRELRVTPADTPHLQAMLTSEEPNPLFFRSESEDPFVRRLMAEFGSQALMAVPIAARGSFFGVLTVAVTADAERLRTSPELLDRLRGVVAHAATALANGRLVDRITREARHDSLTGLLGHRALQESLELAADAPPDDCFSLALIDIDDFKAVNDIHGHQTGDDVLRHLADTLRLNVREHDRVFRVGGEEFCVLMPGLQQPDAVQVAERLRLAVARARFRLPLRISAGVATYPVDGATREALLGRADAALYAAKRSGKNRTSTSADVGGAASPGPGQPGLLHLLRGKHPQTCARGAHVAALAVDIGRALSLDGERLHHLRVAAEHHDIGKVAVPAAILEKPAALTDDERRLVESHPTVGAELLRAWGFPGSARFVLEHHERVDGEGYPAGLVGEEISLEARIIHLVDAFTAMTSDRPFRAALSHAEALAELRRHRGSQFDPGVVDAFERLQDGTQTTLAVA
jgi:diguanylate cyclase (GGDEF)-like protein